MKIILLDGSTGAVSHTNTLLKHLAGLFVAGGSEAQVVRLNNLGLPINDPAMHADPLQSHDAAVRSFVELIEGADSIVLGTPLYHGSFSGLLKTGLDHLRGDAFAGKRVLLVSNSSGPRNSLQGAQQLVIVARTLQGRVWNRMIGTCPEDYTRDAASIVLSSTEIIDRCAEIVQEMMTEGD